MDGTGGTNDLSTYSRSETNLLPEQTRKQHESPCNNQGCLVDS